MPKQNWLPLKLLVTPDKSSNTSIPEAGIPYLRIPYLRKSYEKADPESLSIGFLESLGLLALCSFSP